MMRQGLSLKRLLVQRGGFARLGDLGQAMKDLQARVRQGLSRSHIVLQRRPQGHHTN